MRTLIRDATLVLPDEIGKYNLLLEDGKIAVIDPAVHTLADQIVHAAGMHLLPGVIDDQVHFREPGFTHKEDLASGSRACAAGGVTTFLEMPNTSPATTSQQALNAKLELAASKCVVNFGFYMGATPHNWKDLRDATRTPGIKIFIGSSTGDLLVDDQDALERIFAETTLPICAHCEDETIVRRNAAEFATSHDVADHSNVRDAEAAYVSTKRAVDLAKRFKHRFHVLHVSTAAEVELFREHENLITAEACPHHLLFNIHDYERLGTRVQMNPSIKTPEDNAGLWQALHDGYIQVIATDHAPHTLEEKRQAYPQSPSGLPAVENSLALMLDQMQQGRCTLRQIADWMCDAPARVWDIVDKGRIAEGHDADLVLVDLNLEQVVRDEQQFTKSRWSPWHGIRLRGWPVRTWVLGNEVYRDGTILPKVRGSEANFFHDLGGFWVP